MPALPNCFRRFLPLRDHRRRARQVFEDEGETAWAIAKIADEWRRQSGEAIPCDFPSSDSWFGAGIQRFCSAVPMFPWNRRPEAFFVTQVAALALHVVDFYGHSQLRSWAIAAAVDVVRFILRSFGYRNLVGRRQLVRVCRGIIMSGSCACAYPAFLRSPP